MRRNLPKEQTKASIISIFGYSARASPFKLESRRKTWLRGNHFLHHIWPREERTMQSNRAQRGWSIIQITSILWVFVTVVAWPSAADAVSADDFSDLNDTANPTWTHLDGLVASTGQTWDASTGQYRMTAQNNGFSSLGFVGSYIAA
jgi:hypothetical protein